MKIKGNIVVPGCSGFGEIQWHDSVIEEISLTGKIREDASWILPGFIEMHLHGTGNYNVEGGEQAILGMSEFLAGKGVCRFLPTYSCAPIEDIIEFTGMIRKLAGQRSPGAIIAGSHLEGPWLSAKYCGGMLPEMIQHPNIPHAQKLLDAAGGTLKLMTIAPENPGALEVIRFMKANGVIMSMGHTGCPPAMLEDAVKAGITEVCHLFDTFELPEDHEGVRQPALTDLVLIRDGLMKEIIMDGLHVPPPLVMLSKRAAGADHIIGITDALQGAGLPEGHFLDCGKPYVIREGDFARREEDDAIIGSSLTMNRAFFNMTTKFGFTPEEASLSLAGNQAKQLKIDHLTGSLQKGKMADITVLAPDRLTVQATYIGGRKVYEE